MAEENPRAIMLGMLRIERKLTPESLRRSLTARAFPRCAEHTRAASAR